MTSCVSVNPVIVPGWVFIERMGNVKCNICVMCGICMYIYYCAHTGFCSIHGQAMTVDTWKTCDFCCSNYRSATTVHIFCVLTIHDKIQGDSKVPVKLNKNFSSWPKLRLQVVKVSHVTHVSCVPPTERVCTQTFESVPISNTCSHRCTGTFASPCIINKFRSFHCKLLSVRTFFVTTKYEYWVSGTCFG